MQSANKNYLLSDLGARVNGAVRGDQTLPIKGLSSLEDARPNHLCFIRTNSQETLKRSLSALPPHSAAIVAAEVLGDLPPQGDTSLIVVKDPYPSFLDLVPLFFEEARPGAGVHPTAVIEPSARIGAGASIGPHCVIGARVVIGDNAILYPSVTIYDDVVIGDSVTLFSGTSIRSGSQIGSRVTIHDHAVIGADGFGYIPDPSKGLRKVPQIGNVKIESDVEIGAQTCIDRGAFGTTVVGRGTKIDNLVQIGHNVSIGSHCVVCGQAAIGGSTTIHDGVVIGGAASIADHLEILSGVRLGGRSGVTTSLTEPGDYMGFPAIKAAEWRRQQVLLRKGTRKDSNSGAKRR